MRSWLVLILLVGCLDPQTVEAPAVRGGAPAGTFSVADGALRPASIPGVVATEDGFVVDMRARMHADEAALLAVQALAPGRVSFRFSIDVIYSPPPAGNPDGDEPDGACYLSEGLHAAYAQYLVDRALGEPAGAPVAGQFAGRSYAHTANFPGERRFTETEAAALDVEADTWAVVLAGTSQVPEHAFTGDGIWSVNITSEVPLRLVALPPAPLYCAYGFQAVEDGERTDLMVTEVQRGGGLDVHSIYGMTLGMCPPGQDRAADQTDRNKATLRFGTDAIPMRHGDRYWNTTFDPITAGIEIEEWWGYPSFQLIGLPSPLFTKGPVADAVIQPTPPMHGTRCWESA